MLGFSKVVGGFELNVDTNCWEETTKVVSEFISWGHICDGSSEIVKCGVVLGYRAGALFNGDNEVPVVTCI